MTVSDEQKSKMSQFYRDNKDRYAYYAAGYRDKLRQEMVEAYGSICSVCGESDPIVLVLDHINDDAHIERDAFGANARGGHKHYARLKKEGWPKDRFQLLCCNCNARKEHVRRRDALIARWGEFTPSTTGSRSLAHANVDPPAHNVSGFKGVFWFNGRNCWQARIIVNHKAKFLGYHNDIRDAARAYRKAAIETWGEYAKVPTDEEIERIAAERNAPVVIDAASAEELDL